MTKIMDTLYQAVWGVPGISLILCAGIYLTVYSGGVQLRLFSSAVRLFGKQLSRRGSGFRSLCTALAATVGTGNLVGVAGAICLGGPGSVFWMLLCAFFGMGIKFCEAALAVRYRIRIQGQTVGGPMYTIVKGLGKRWRPLAVCYCLCGVAASFGIGNAVQVNTIVSGLSELLPTSVVGILLCFLVGAVLLGGVQAISNASERIIPVAAGGYILFCLLFLLIRIRSIPAALLAVGRGIFSPKAVTGGMVGSAFRVMQYGCSRGVFTNEAGMGTAAIAHASGEESSVEQGMLGIVEVFLDTVVICTLTALVILTSGISIPYGIDDGYTLATSAFSSVYGYWGNVLISAFLVCFAFATILGWSLYGLRCAQFLFGIRCSGLFLLLQTAAVIPASLLPAPLIWRISELLNGTMMIPNLICLLLLSPVLRRTINQYLQKQ